MKTFTDVFHDQCRRAPTAPAIIDGGARLTFAELHRWSARLSLALAPHVSPGQRVALLLPNGSALAAAFLAAACVDGVVAPLDTRDGVAVLARELRDLDAAALVTDPAGTASAVAATADLEEPPAIVRLHADDADVIERRPTPARALGSDDSAPLLQLATSNSTDGRRRVVRSHAGVLGELEALRETLGLTAADRVLGLGGVGRALLSALGAGATLYSLETFHPRQVLALLGGERITVFEGGPSIFAALADLPQRGDGVTRSLRLALSSGASLAEAANRAFHARYGPFVRQVYDSAVTGTISVNSDADPERALTSVGRPLPGVRVKTLGGGELAVASPFAAPGYLDDPEATAASFCGGFYLTGDVGARARAGTITITRRRS